MRFPQQLVGKDTLLHAHHMTLLDGEMVVDEDMAAGTQHRRFLAYDLIALNGESLVRHPFKVFLSGPCFAVDCAIAKHHPV
jgi:mRNA-capping enzyme